MFSPRVIQISMNKQHIVDEIRRTAKANGGIPLGIQRFLTETGIKYSDIHVMLAARTNKLKNAGAVLLVEIYSKLDQRDISPNEIRK